MADSKEKFDYTVARTLHWVTAYIIFFNLVSGWRLDDLSQPVKRTLVMVHAGFGTAIGVLTLLRWWWRRSRKLYVVPNWWRSLSLLLQWSFYPLLLIQVAIGIVHTAFIGYDVLAFGLIEYSALAPDNEGLHGLFLKAHRLIGVLLVVLIAIHALEPVPTSRQFCRT